MQSKSPFHVVSFDSPWPADYGGALDVFHKVRTLHAIGQPVVLHYFAYGDRGQIPAEHCHWQKAFSYTRYKHWSRLLRLEPFISNSRRNPELLRNLASQEGPILFEGMHCLSWLGHPKLAGRRQVLRCHNLEHQYYRHLAQDESRLLKKLYLHSESAKLWLALPQLRKASALAAISEADGCWMQKQGMPPTEIIPPFHGTDVVDVPSGVGSHILFHGNLGVAENHQAAQFLLEIAPRLRLPLVIAGRHPSAELQKRAARCRVELVASPTEEGLAELMRKAQIHAFPIARGDGAKLKLLRSCFAGRHCVVHPAIVQASPLQGLCTLATSSKQWVRTLDELSYVPVQTGQISLRERVFSQNYDNLTNARKLQKLLLGENI